MIRKIRGIMRERGTKNGKGFGAKILNDTNSFVAGKKAVVFLPQNCNLFGGKSNVAFFVIFIY